MLFERFGARKMKRILTFVCVLVFVCSMAISASALVSPIAPTIETTRPTTAFHTTTQPVAPTQRTTVDVGGDDRTTTRLTDDTTRRTDDTTRHEVTTAGPIQSDTNPSSPSTGMGNTVSRTVAAAVLTVSLLSVAGVYVSKKKIAE